MNSGTLVPVFCITAVLSLISLICQIYVSRVLARAGAKIMAPVGKRSWITPFIQGWQNSKQLEITDVMLFWSVILCMTFMGIIMTVFAFLAARPSL